MSAITAAFRVVRIGIEEVATHAGTDAGNETFGVNSTIVRGRRRRGLGERIGQVAPWERRC